MNSFVQRSPLMKLILRDNVLELLPAELKLLGIQHPLIISGHKAMQSPLYGRLKETLCAMPALFSQPVPAHSSVSIVEDMAAQAKNDGVDGLIALGGGSASDSTKAVALLMAEGGRLIDHASQFTPPSTLHVPVLLRPKMPIVSIPCTASGAEATVSLGVRDEEGRKLLFTDFQLASRLILIDPLANLDVPAKLMLSTGMNGLAHCIEGLYSLERAPMAETLALDALVRFFKVLPAVQKHPNERQHRAELLYAAHLSGLVLVHARTCLHHAICHAIGSVCGVGHGDANSVMLPHALAFNSEATASALSRAARILDCGSDASDFLRALKVLQEQTSVPQRLRDIGVGYKTLDRIATKTMGERGLYFNPRHVNDASEIRQLLEQAY
ncbi:MAG: iron-containing alcohol dehydrogenase [Betaproteobacteria bacterium]|nr:iron-containing alcohol dehydrogenase [Betaproteobacteria bacterium]